MSKNNNDDNYNRFLKKLEKSVLDIEDLNEVLIEEGIKYYYKDAPIIQAYKLFDFIEEESEKDKENNEKPAIDAMFVGDIAVIDRSTIERGIHLSVPTIISPAGLSKYLEEDKDLLTEIVTGKRPDLSNQYICLVQFKIVPISTITATYDAEEKVQDDFILVRAQQ